MESERGIIGADLCVRPLQRAKRQRRRTRSREQGVERRPWSIVGFAKSEGQRAGSTEQGNCRGKPLCLPGVVRGPPVSLGK